MSDTKERKMSAKGFLHKSSGKAANSAEAFITAHRAWLQTGELAELTSPILVRIDAKEILPTPGLKALRAVVLGYHLQEETVKAENKMARDQEGGQATPKNWTCTIYTKDGEVAQKMSEATGELVSLEKGFELGQDADRWTDRQLALHGEGEWFGVIAHSTIVIKGEPMTTVVMRNDALARFYKESKGPIMRKTGSKGGKFGVKAKQDVAYFSRG